MLGSVQHPINLIDDAFDVLVKTCTEWKPPRNVKGPTLLARQSASQH